MGGSSGLRSSTQGRDGKELGKPRGCMELDTGQKTTGENTGSRRHHNQVGKPGGPPAFGLWPK